MKRLIFFIVLVMAFSANAQTPFVPIIQGDTLLIDLKSYYGYPGYDGFDIFRMDPSWGTGERPIRTLSRFAYYKRKYFARHGNTNVYVASQFGAGSVYRRISLNITNRVTSDVIEIAFPVRGQNVSGATAYIGNNVFLEACRTGEIRTFRMSEAGSFLDADYYDIANVSLSKNYDHVYIFNLSGGFSAVVFATASSRHIVTLTASSGDISIVDQYSLPELTHGFLSFLLPGANTLVFSGDWRAHTLKVDEVTGEIIRGSLVLYYQSGEHFFRNLAYSKQIDQNNISTSAWFSTGYSITTKILNLSITERIFNKVTGSYGPATRKIYYLYRPTQPFSNPIQDREVPILSNGKVIYSFLGTAEHVIFDPNDTYFVGAPLNVVNIYPTGSNISRSTNVVVGFDRYIQLSSLSSSTFQLKQGATPIAGARTLSGAGGASAVFTPYSPLEYNTEYTFTVTTGVLGVGNERLASDTSWSFTTEADPDPGDVDPPYVISTDPNDEDEDVAINKSPITITFNEPIFPACVTSTNVKLSTGSTFLSPFLSTNGNMIEIRPRANLLLGEVYTVDLTTGVTDLAGNPLAEAYSFSFTTEQPPPGDTQPPVVVFVDPTDGATEVEITKSPLRVGFSEPLLPSTVNLNTVRLYRNGTLISRSVSLSEDVISITPVSRPLEYDTEYNIEVTTGVQDLSGNALASVFTSTFTTRDVPPPPPDTDPPYVISVDPPDAAIDVSIMKSPIRIIFNEDIKSASVTTETIKLKYNSDEHAISLNVDGSMINISPLSQLFEGVIYTIEATTGVTDLAGNPLEATFNSIFTTIEPPLVDTDPPTVIFSDPNNGATGVRITKDSFKIGFSEPLLPGSVNNSTIRLYRGSTQLSKSVNFDIDVVEIVPSNKPLYYNTVYTIEATTGIKDTANNSLASIFKATFTTEDVPPPPPDTDPPYVISVDPPDAAIDVSLTKSPIRVVFNEAIRANTVNTVTVKLRYGSDYHTITPSVSGSAIEIRPADILLSDTEYHIEVSAVIADLAGNNLASPFTSSFTTEDPWVPPEPPPYIPDPEPVVEDTSIAATDVSSLYSNGNVILQAVRDDSGNVDIEFYQSYSSGTLNLLGSSNLYTDLVTGATNKLVRLGRIGNTDRFFVIYDSTDNVTILRTFSASGTSVSSIDRVIISKEAFHTYNFILKNDHIVIVMGNGQTDTGRIKSYSMASDGTLGVTHADSLAISNCGWPDITDVEDNYFAIGYRSSTDLRTDLYTIDGAGDLTYVRNSSTAETITSNIKLTYNPLNRWLNFMWFRYYNASYQYTFINNRVRVSDTYTFGIINNNKVYVNHATAAAHSFVNHTPLGKGKNLLMIAGPGIRFQKSLMDITSNNLMFHDTSLVVFETRIVDKTPRFVTAANGNILISYATEGVAILSNSGYVYDNTLSGEVYLGPDGHDFSGDGTEDNPYRSLTVAMAATADGGTLYIQPGTTVLRSPDGGGRYTAGNTMTIDRGVSIIGILENNQMPVIFRGESAKNDWLQYSATGKDILIKRIIFVNENSTDMVGTSYDVITGSNANGVTGVGCNLITFEQCAFMSSCKDGTDWLSDVSGITIQNSDARFINCVFLDLTTGLRISSAGVGNVDIINTNFIGNRTYGINRTGGTVTADHCNFYGNATDINGTVTNTNATYNAPEAVFSYARSMYLHYLRRWRSYPSSTTTRMYRGALVAGYSDTPGSGCYCRPLSDAYRPSIDADAYKYLYVGLFVKAEPFDIGADRYPFIQWQKNGEWHTKLMTANVGYDYTRSSWGVTELQRYAPIKGVDVVDMTAEVNWTGTIDSLRIGVMWDEVNYLHPRKGMVFFCIPATRGDITNINGLLTGSKMIDAGKPEIWDDMLDYSTGRTIGKGNLISDIWMYGGVGDAGYLSAEEKVTINKVVWPHLFNGLPESEAMGMK